MSRQTIVKSYGSRRQMQRGINRLAGRGYRMQSQSGEFTRNPFALRWNRRKVVVAFERENGPPPTGEG